jgi:hyperosmotically inducible periplasmic protein
MKTRLLIRKGLYTLGLLALWGLAIGVPAGRAGAGAVDKSSLDSKVHRELVTLPWYGVFDNLEYRVNGSQVILSGQVVSEHSQTKHDAENAVKRIPGITEVVNQIEVLPPLPFDDQIRREEYRAIFSQSNLGGYSMGTLPQIRIIVNGGHVTLEGTVMNQMDRNIAGLAANSVSNVFSVTNNLKIG